MQSIWKTMGYPWPIQNAIAYLKNNNTEIGGKSEQSLTCTSKMKKANGQ